MSKLDDWLPDLSKSDRSGIDLDIHDTKIYLEACTEHVRTMKRILRRIENPELEKMYEGELESAIADVNGYQRDLDELREVQQAWDRKFMEE